MTATSIMSIISSKSGLSRIWSIRKQYNSRGAIKAYHRIRKQRYLCFEGLKKNHYLILKSGITLSSLVFTRIDALLLQSSFFCTENRNGHISITGLDSILTILTSQSQKLSELNTEFVKYTFYI